MSKPPTGYPYEVKGLVKASEHILATDKRHKSGDVWRLRQTQTAKAVHNCGGTYKGIAVWPDGDIDFTTPISFWFKTWNDANNFVHLPKWGNLTNIWTAKPLVIDHNFNGYRFMLRKADGEVVGRYDDENEAVLAKMKYESGVVVTLLKNPMRV